MLCLRATYEVGVSYPVEIQANDSTKTVTARVFYLPQILSPYRKNLLEFVSAVNFELTMSDLETGNGPYLKYRESFTRTETGINAEFDHAFLLM
jgi:hypothetical protein